ncbi:UNKNOWN [Stylonychia lemnae]|uniref:Uncharacterized protein n=1 Tax=Stylonychia lemnae TaxID=5949 RepID=A0A078AP07_STYLE|nr:UNKNOWN [Stylonychia lemnae]|eukprot:CDW82698.1 UNKNOWN [Stylonychia lemnae]
MKKRNSQDQHQFDFSSIQQLQGDMDLTYISKMLEQSRQRIQQISYIEQRSQLDSDVTSIEDELNSAYNEIKDNEKSMKSILTITEFLFDTYQELQIKIEEDYIKIEDQKREIDAEQYKSSVYQEELELKNKTVSFMQQTQSNLETQLKQIKDENVKLKSQTVSLSRKLNSDEHRIQMDLEQAQTDCEHLQKLNQEYYDKITHMQNGIEEYNQTIEKLSSDMQKKDLTINTLQKENEELNKNKKNLAQKVMEYQQINEVMRKDKKQLESEKADYKKKLDMHQMISQSAAFLSQGHLEDDDSQESMHRLNDLEGFNDSFQDDQNQQYYQTQRMETPARNFKSEGLNQSFGSDDFNQNVVQNVKINSQSDYIEAYQQAYETQIDRQNQSVISLIQLDVQEKVVDLKIVNNSLRKQIQSKTQNQDMEFDKNSSSSKSPIGSNPFTTNSGKPDANRDVIKEFFTLTLQSVKLNSPNMNLICAIKPQELYDKVQSLQVPFYQKTLEKTKEEKQTAARTNPNASTASTTQRRGRDSQGGKSNQRSKSVYKKDTRLITATKGFGKF